MTLGHCGYNVVSDCKRDSYEFDSFRENQLFSFSRSGLQTSAALNSATLFRPENLKIRGEPSVLTLVHTKAEKAHLIRKGYRRERNSRIPTINEYHGFTYRIIPVGEAARALYLYNNL